MRAGRLAIGSPLKEARRIDAGQGRHGIADHYADMDSGRAKDAQHPVRAVPVHAKNTMRIVLARADQRCERTLLLGRSRGHVELQIVGLGRRHVTRR